MLKLIFKNLWNRRGKYAWLFIELVTITIISWFILDDAIISTADANLPLGYDADRMALISVRSYPEGANNYNQAESDSAKKADNFKSLLAKVRSYPEVENLTYGYGWDHMNSGSLNISSYPGLVKPDSTPAHAIQLQFIANTNFFEAYGFTEIEGYPSLSELSKSTGGHKKIIITKDFADICFPGENAMGKEFVQVFGSDTVRNEIIGVVGNARYQSFNRTNVMAFYGREQENSDEYEIAVRLRQGVDPDDFCRDFSQWAMENLKTGNYYFQTAQPFSQIISGEEYDRGISSKRQGQWLLAAFFLINLILGVVGSFYLQTQRRVEEMGIHRSYGALKRQIRAMLIGEASVLTILAFIVGDLIFLQIALRNGLSEGYSNNGMFALIDNWTSSFWPHFAVVSAIIFVLILLCVITGVYFPARNVSNINPIDALRDE